MRRASFCQILARLCGAGPCPAPGAPPGSSRVNPYHNSAPEGRAQAARLPHKKLLLVLVPTCLFSQSLDQAKHEFEAGHYTTAAQFFEAAAKEPHQCEALFYLGAARYRLKQLDPALIAFQAAVECNPKLVNARVALAEAYGQKRNFDEALKAYKAALEIDPASAPALRGAAAIYMAREQNYDALPLLEKLVVQRKDDAAAHADLGAVYAATSNHDGAKKQFEQALRLSPRNASALTGLANLSFKNGDDARGISLLKKSIESAPKAFEPHYLLGSAYNRAGKYREALAELDAALQVADNQPEVYYQLARAYGGVGRDADRRAAIAKFEALSRKTKDQAEAQRTAGKLLHEASTLVDSGDLNGALARMEEAHRLLPVDDKTLFRMAGLEYDLHKYDAARIHIEAALRIAPSEWLYQFLFGLVNRSHGKLPEAQASLETALRLNPAAAPVHNAVGELALEQNHPQQAVASFEKATQLDPQQAAYRANLERARAALARH
jgi:tetratricopeptide (TPR) repeat protein